MARSLTIMSAALNVALLMLLGLRPGTGQSETQGDFLPLQSETNRNEIFSTEPQALRAELVSYGLDRMSVDKLVLARVLESTVEDSRSSERYWEITRRTSYERALALVDAQDRARKRILGIYGPAAKRNPAFSTLFRPLDAQFSFLSSDEQLAVERLRLGFLHEQLSAEADHQRAGRGGETRPGLPVHARFSAALADLIGAESAFEYELRESPLATQLRASETDFSESSYRDAFRILSTLNRSEPSRDEYVQARTRLRELLGEQAFARLWSKRDPRFGVVQRVGKRESLSDDQIAAAYQILNDGQDALLRALAAYGDHPEQGAARARELQALQRRRLAELVGETITDRLVAALAGLSIDRRERRVPL